MNQRPLLLSAIAILLTGLAGAQNLDVPKAYDAGVKAMDTGQYDQGLEEVGKVLAEHGENGGELYGPVFGHFHYLKGMLHIRKKEYEKAIAAFRTCFDDYPNAGNAGDNANRFRDQCLVQWAGCLMQLGDYRGAAARYREALALEESFEPKIDRTETQVNLSKAMVLSGENPNQGRDFLVQQIEDPKYTTDEKRALFLMLMNDWSPAAPFPEVKPYLAKYRDMMLGDTPVSRYLKQNPVYNSLAAQAISAKDPARALAWYDMMIDPVEVATLYSQRIQKLKQQIDSGQLSPEDVAAIRSDLAVLEPELRNQRKQWAEMLMGKASAYYALKQLGEARTNYETLLDKFPNHPDRAVILHNLAICCVNTGEWEKATEYGTEFIRKHADHELQPSMAKVLVETLFVREKYEEAHRVADRLRTSMPPASPPRDVPDFIAGAALYHLGRFPEAETELEKYLEDYPEGQRSEQARFYIGATRVNLQKWEEATAVLDDFLERYRNSDLRPSALYFSGLSQMVGGNLPIANSRMVELQARHPRDPQVPNSYNILGDILAAREKPYPEITEAYRKALSLVEKEGRGDANVAAYALKQLIEQAGFQEKWEIAARYYDHFARSYQESSWRSDVVVAAIRPLTETGRTDEARDLLVGTVNEFSEKPDSTELDQIFASYAEFLNGQYSVDEVRTQLRNFPATSSPPPPALQAWLYLAEIEAMSEAGEKDYGDEIRATFRKLNDLYGRHGTALSSYTLVKLARYNSQSGGGEDQARQVYEYILKERPSGEAAGLALVDLAKIDAAKDTAKSRQAAKRLFQRVLNEVDDPAAHEEAVHGIARIETVSGNHAEAIGWWERYRAEPSWRKFRAEASFLYGQCLLEQGDRDEAAAVFVNVYSNFPAQLDWSTRAYIETAKIVRAKGQELDALKLLREMIQRMGHFDHPGVAEGRKLFYDWREAYVGKQKG